NERVENKSSQQTKFIIKQLQRGCFDYQIGFCPGPCAGKISTADYGRTIQKVTLFLQGKKRQVAKKIEREMSLAAKKHDFETAATLRNQLFALNHLRDVALLKKDRPVSKEGDSAWQRIEGYDISNIGQDNAVASMVVVTNGETDKNAYRKFQIKTVIGQNDLKMMEEVLTRRFRHLEWPLPNLVVIDGGAEHLKIGQRVLKRAKLAIPIIGVAKGPERKKLDLYSSVANLPLTDPEFLARIRLARDEAHRFAIRYHRKRRDTNFLNT
ncbi:MAG: UvrB/UvrC motif-containing protein, partial [Patescibacteria group bacterium]